MATTVRAGARGRVPRVRLLSSNHPSLTIDPSHPVALRPGTRYIVSGRIRTQPGAALNLEVRHSRTDQPLASARPLEWTTFRRELTTRPDDYWLGPVRLRLEGKGLAWLSDLSLKAATIPGSRGGARNSDGHSPQPSPIGWERLAEGRVRADSTRDANPVETRTPAASQQTSPPALRAPSPPLPAEEKAVERRRRSVPASSEPTNGGPELLWGAEINRPVRGFYNPLDCFMLDELVATAAERGIYLQLCLSARDLYMNALKDPTSTDYDRAMTDAKHLLRYAVARWGCSTSVAAWEYWNEMNPHLHAAV